MRKGLPKRLLSTERFNERALGLIPQPQRALLKKWLLKSNDHSRSLKWDRLAKIATDLGGQQYVEIAESLTSTLADCGAAIVEQCQMAGGLWVNSSLAWRDYEALCAALNIVTTDARRASFDKAWNEAQDIQWERSEFAEAYLSLPEEPTASREKKLALLVKLNDWIRQRENGTRRNFSLFARSGTKELTGADWAWLNGIIDLEECGIAKHAPALWLAGDVRFQVGDRWIDIGAAEDFVALTPTTLQKIVTAKTGASRFHLIENRTSFENVARNALSNCEIVIWLPGYAPNWWRASMACLLDVLPMAVDISCDADPDGVQIALQAAELWAARKLPWKPSKMGVAEASAARFKRALTSRDAQLATRLLDNPQLPKELRTFLHWSLGHRIKVEQENWL